MTDKIFNVRTTIVVPENVLAGLDELADANLRSRTQEIVRILRDAVKEHEKTKA